MSAGFPRPLLALVVACALVACNDGLPLESGADAGDFGPQRTHTPWHPEMVDANNYHLGLTPLRIGLSTFHGDYVMFGGNIAYGTDASHVYFADTNGNEPSFEVSGLPMLVEVGGASADHYTSSLIFETDEHPLGERHPLGVMTVRETFAFSAAPNDDFVLVRYTLVNPSDEDITGMQVGFVGDPDVGGNPGANATTFVGDGQFAMTFDPSGEMFSGTALVSEQDVNLQVWAPFGGSAPTTYAGWHDLLTRPTQNPLTNWTDVRGALTTGPVTLPAAGSTTVDVAFAGASTYSEMVANVHAARAKFESLGAPTPVVHPVDVSMRTIDGVTNATIDFSDASIGAGVVNTAIACGGALVDVTGTTASTVSVRFAASGDPAANESVYCAGRLSDGSYFAGIGSDVVGSTLQLGAAVQSLVDAGQLDARGGAMLVASLEDVATKLERGQIGAALNKVGAFINQVNALINSRRIGEIEGQQLIDDGNALAAQIAA